MTKILDIVKWAESPHGFYLADTKRPIVLADHQKDLLRHCFTPAPDGKLPYETIVFSCPKKSGKTTLGALVATYYGLFLEAAGGEIYLCANDLEQSQGRVFADVKTAVKLNQVLAKRTSVKAKDIVLDDGTTIKALPSDYAGAAGSRHGLTVWDELWAYVSESSRRLWDELTPVPTKLNSIRLVVTYAGFEGESELLEELYKRGKAGELVPELAHISNGRDKSACRANGRTFVYWDHELKPHAGLAVSPQEYHEQQRQDLRPGAFARMHLNEWASSMSRFVDAEQWQACYSPIVKALIPGDGQRAIFGADASTSRDLTALVGCQRQYDGTIHTVYCRVWKPKKGTLRGGKATIDLSDTIGAEIIELHKKGHVAGVVYDPYQLHSIALDLEKAGVKMIELPQTAQRTQADQALYDAIVGHTIKHYNHPTLNEHIANAVARETARGFRLDKEKTTKKIDAAVALSMAHHGALGIPHYEPAGAVVNYELEELLPNIAARREGRKPLFRRKKFRLGR